MGSRVQWRRMGAMISQRCGQGRRCVLVRLRGEGNRAETGHCSAGQGNNKVASNRDEQTDMAQGGRDDVRMALAVRGSDFQAQHAYPLICKVF